MKVAHIQSGRRRLSWNQRTSRTVEASGGRASKNRRRDIGNSFLSGLFAGLREKGVERNKTDAKRVSDLKIPTKNQRKVITKRMFLESTYNEVDFVEENSLVPLNRLRNKFSGAFVSHPIYIRNVLDLAILLEKQNVKKKKKRQELEEVS